MEPASLIDWIIRVSVFGLVLSLWSAGVLLYVRRRGRKKSRAGRMDMVMKKIRILIGI